MTVVSERRHRRVIAGTESRIASDWLLIGYVNAAYPKCLFPVNGLEQMNAISVKIAAAAVLL